MAMDSSGSQYVAGSTASPDFPVTSTALGTPSETSACAFVTKFNPRGTAIAFSICVANSKTLAFGMDARNNIYLAVIEFTPQGVSSYAVLKLDPSGQHILYNTPIGVAPESMAVDASGNVYLAGTAGPGFVTTPGAYQTQLSPGMCGGINVEVPCNDAFAMKLAPSGALVWATYLGGSGPDDAHAIAVDSSGNTWIVGETASPNFPMTPGAFDSSFGGEVDFGPLQWRRLCVEVRSHGRQAALFDLPRWHRA